MGLGREKVGEGKSPLEEAEVRLWSKLGIWVIFLGVTRWGRGHPGGTEGWRAVIGGPLVFPGAWAGL